jgi:hypothetical protein
MANRKEAATSGGPILVSTLVLHTELLSDILQAQSIVEDVAVSHKRAVESGTPPYHRTGRVRRSD